MIRLGIPSFIRLWQFVLLGALFVITVPSQTIAGELTREQNIEARKALTKATILQKSGKSLEAAAFLKQKFPNGPPSDEYVTAYYRIIASTPDGWVEAKAGLEALIKADPKNLQYQLALASLLGAKSSTRIEAVSMFSKLAKDANIDKQKVLQAWRETLNSLESTQDSVKLLQEYLSVDPQNQEMGERLQNEKRLAKERSLIAADPVLSRRQVGLDFLDKGDVVKAEPILLETLKATPNDPQTIGALGLVRLKQGRHPEAIVFFQKALELNPENSAKWKSLITTSRYWQLIRESADASNSENYSLALEKAKEAVILDGEGAEAYGQLGRAYAGKKQFSQAEKYFGDALQLEANNETALQGMILLCIQTGRRSEAMALITAAARSPGADPKRFNYLCLQLLSAEADDLIAKSDLNRATEVLKQAVSLDPSNPWIRLKLADVYKDAGNQEAGLAIMRDAVRLNPRSSEAIRATAIYLSSINRDQQAYELISGYIKSTPKPDLAIQLTYADLLNRMGQDSELAVLLDKLGKQALTGQSRVDYLKINLSYQIRQAETKGDQKKVQTLLQEAIKLSPQDIWLQYDLAKSYAQTGNPNKGDEILRVFTIKYPKNIEAYYAYSLYLSGIDAYPESLRVLESIPVDSRSKKITQYQRQLWVRAQLSQAQVLYKTNPSAARSILANMEVELENDSDLLASVGLAWLNFGDQIRAEKLFKKTVQENAQQSVSWHLQYAKFLLETNQKASFDDQVSMLNKKPLDRAELKQLTELRTAAQLKSINSYIQAGDLKQANRLLDPVLKEDPKNYQAISLLSQIQRREGEVDKAISLEQFALASAPIPLSAPGGLSRLKPVDTTSSSGVKVLAIDPPLLRPSAVSSGESYQYKQVAELLDSRANWFSTAVDYLSLSGTPGQSSYRASEIPLEWRMPIRSDENLIFRADQVHIDAGSIDLNNSYQTSTFGSMALCQPNCSSALTQQSATGTALNVGYAKQGFKADIGTTPIGFLVQNWIGGIRQKGDIGPVGYVVDLNRRPMTSTMLSYAGTRDPRTGSIWGGVVATGGSIGLSLDKGGTLGGWTTFRARSLTGVNVQSNSDTQFMAGLNWRIINETDRLLTSGLTGMLWAFQKNAGEFTYGQGGYYSPQSYRSITLPLSYSQRFARFSYVVSGTVSSNWSRTDAAPYYPTNADYQTAAGNPYYASSSGPGSAYSFLAGWEYQMSPSLFVGNRLKLERSPYYAPNSFVIYLRYAFDQTAAQPVMLQAQPVIPTSRF